MRGVKVGSLLYQLEKVDQGGEVQDLFEAHVERVAEAFGLEVDEETCEIILPDGRRAGLGFDAYVSDVEP